MESLSANTYYSNHILYTYALACMLTYSMENNTKQQQQQKMYVPTGLHN